MRWRWHGAGAGTGAGRAQVRTLKNKPSDIFVVDLSHQGTQAYEEVLSHKAVSSEDDKNEGKGSEEEAKIL